MVVLTSKRSRDHISCSTPECRGMAEVCCFTRRKYFCRVCDIQTLISMGKEAEKVQRTLCRDMKAYVDFSGPPPKNCSDTRRNWCSVNGLYKTFQDGDVVRDTVFSSFKASCDLYGDLDYLGHRTFSNGLYTFISYRETMEQVIAIADGMAEMGIPNRSVVGIYLQNRAEWIIAEYASYCYGHINVPLYDTLGVESASYIINQSNISVIFTSQDKLETLSICVHSGQCPSLKLIIVVPPLPYEKETVISSHQFTTVQTVPFLLLVKTGQNVRGKRLHEPSLPDDLATICYTSGTTGLPKGVELTHTMLMCNIGAFRHHGVMVDSSDVHISYLPLPHMFERICHGLLVAGGAKIGFFRGDVSLLIEDIQELKPTIFVGVPRLYNRIHSKITAQLDQSGILKKFIFDTAFASKQNYLSEGHLSHSIWDPLVFSKLRDALGGRVKLLISGAAPISGQVVEFLRIAFSAPFIEGYGMTETATGGTVTDSLDVNSTGNVGYPIRSVEIKLEDVPEMKYTSRDISNGVLTPRGEICFRGPGITSGYFKSPEKTAETIDKDGWLHSGDIGVFLPDQTLKIVDRKKNIFKLAQGEYIAPEKIENVYTKSHFVAQVFVYGSSLEPNLVAIVVPDEEFLVGWGSKNGFEGRTFKELVSDPKVQELIEHDMQKHAKAGKLHGFEMAKKMYFDSALFSVENGLLTPTMKLKRPQAQKKYQKEISEMYTALNKLSQQRKSKL